MDKLVLENVNKGYGKKKVLQDISLTVGKGECLGIMGRSGSGKSTLARLIVRLEDFDSGDIKVDGISYYKASKKEVRILRQKIQMVFQNSLGAVNPRFTVEDVLTEPLTVYYRNKMSRNEMSQRTEKTLEQMGLSGVHLRHYAADLSGGQLQRLCIARALMLEPEVIVFDESLSGLDPIVQQQILELLGELWERLGLTYIFIAHDFNICRYLCNRVVIMEDGRIKDIREDM